MAAHNSSRRSLLKKSAFLAGGASLLGLPFATAQLRTPAPIVPKYKWKLATAWPKNFPGFGTSANLFSQMVQEMSGGKMEIKVYAAGELAPTLGILDAVAKGTVEMGHSSSFYWAQKSPATQFFSSIPFGMTAGELSAWINNGEGQKLWDDIYFPMGVKGFLAGDTGTQMGGWFRKEILKSKDWAGLKIRMPGMAGDVVARLGAKVVNVPAGELLTALSTGALDATEWVSPYNDFAMNLSQGAPFYYAPAWNKPSQGVEVLVNKKLFDGLPKDLQKIIHYATKAAHQAMLDEYTQQNYLSLASLQLRGNVRLVNFSEPVLLDLGRETKAILDDLIRKNGMSQKVYSSYDKFRKGAMTYGKLSSDPYNTIRTKIFA